MVNFLQKVYVEEIGSIVTDPKVEILNSELAAFIYGMYLKVVAQGARASSAIKRVTIFYKEEGISLLVISECSCLPQIVRFFAKCVPVLVKLNVLNFECDLALIDGKHVVFDQIRRAYVRFTPEEWVRQYMISLLSNEEYNYPISLMRIEKELRTAPRIKKSRADIVAFNNKNEPVLLVECKAPTVKLNGETFYQLARYNRSLQASFLLVTNGLGFFCWEKSASGEYMSIDCIPKFEKE